MTRIFRTPQTLLTALLVAVLFTGCSDGLLATSEPAAATEAITIVSDKLRDADLMDEAVRIQATKAGETEVIGLIITITDEASMDLMVERYLVAAQRKFVQRYDLGSNSLSVEVARASLDAFLDELAEDPDVLWITPDVEKRPTDETDR